MFRRRPSTRPSHSKAIWLPVRTLVERPAQVRIRRLTRKIRRLGITRKEHGNRSASTRGGLLPNAVINRYESCDQRITLNNRVKQSNHPPRTFERQRSHQHRGQQQQRGGHAQRGEWTAPRGGGGRRHDGRKGPQPPIEKSDQSSRQEPIEPSADAVAPVTAQDSERRSSVTASNDGAQKPGHKTDKVRRIASVHAIQETLVGTDRARAGRQWHTGASRRPFPGGEAL